jgi:splicing factor 3A subunit 2
MDFQHRPGAKTGSGGPMSYEDANVERRERLKKLAIDTIDLSKDPYFLKNHLGSYECRLCLTLHQTEGSYLSHTQCKKHQTNLARRMARENKQQIILPQPKIKPSQRRIMKIGRPGYKVMKQLDPESQQRSLYFEIDYPEISPDFQPKHRIMSCYEQKLEVADPRYQYLLFAAEPYETIAFKIPNQELDRAADKYYVNWNKDKKIFTLQLCFKDAAVLK